MFDVSLYQTKQRSSYLYHLLIKALLHFTCILPIFIHRMFAYTAAAAVDRQLVTVAHLTQVVHRIHTIARPAGKGQGLKRSG